METRLVSLAPPQGHAFKQRMTTQSRGGWRGASEGRQGALKKQSDRVRERERDQPWDAGRSGLRPGRADARRLSSRGRAAQSAGRNDRNVGERACGWTTMPYMRTSGTKRCASWIRGVSAHLDKATSRVRLVPHYRRRNDDDRLTGWHAY